MNQNKPQYAKKRPPESIDMNLYGKLPPQAQDLETAVLGAMMLERHCIETVLSIIKTPDVFYVDANQRIFSAICTMYQEGRSIDFMTVTAQLRKSGELDMVGGTYFIISLTKDVVSSAHIQEHCRILIEKFMLRGIIQICGTAISNAYTEDSDVFDLLASTEKQIADLSETNIMTPYRQIGYQAETDIEDIQAQREKLQNNDFSLTGVYTGFPTIDKITNGWQPGDLVIMAARPSVGKTAFSLNLAMNAATSREKPVNVGFFSLEMDLKKIRLRVMAMQSSVGITNISSGRITDGDIERLTDNLSKLKGLGIYVDDRSDMTVLDIKSKARLMKRKHGVGLIIIDYLQLITPTNSRAIREQQVSEISRELKKLSKELQMPIIALSQLSRDIEKRTIKEPTLADLRESGAIEQDADLVAFLYRHDDLVKWKLAKHRNGKIDTVDFQANMDIQLFTENGQDDPILKYRGFEPTPMSGKLIPIAEANSKFSEDTEELPF